MRKITTSPMNDEWLVMMTHMHIMTAMTVYLAAEELGWGYLCSGRWAFGPSVAMDLERLSPPDDPVTYPVWFPEPVLPDCAQTPP